MNNIVEDLIKCAIGRHSLWHGMQTARACGDGEWAYQNREALERYDTRLEQLKQQASRSQLQEARDRTNAPI